MIFNDALKRFFEKAKKSDGPMTIKPARSYYRQGIVRACIISVSTIYAAVGTNFILTNTKVGLDYVAPPVELLVDEMPKHIHSADQLSQMTDAEFSQFASEIAQDDVIAIGFDGTQTDLMAKVTPVVDGHLAGERKLSGEEAELLPDFTQPDVPDAEKKPLPEPARPKKDPVQEAFSDQADFGDLPELEEAKLGSIWTTYYSSKAKPFTDSREALLGRFAGKRASNSVGVAYSPYLYDAEGNDHWLMIMQEREQYLQQFSFAGEAIKLRSSPQDFALFVRLHELAHVKNSTHRGKLQYDTGRLYKNRALLTLEGEVEADNLALGWMSQLVDKERYDNFVADLKDWRAVNYIVHRDIKHAAGSDIHVGHRHDEHGYHAPYQPSEDYDVRKGMTGFNVEMVKAHFPMSYTSSNRMQFWAMSLMAEQGLLSDMAQKQLDANPTYADHIKRAAIGGRQTFPETTAKFEKQLLALSVEMQVRALGHQKAMGELSAQDAKQLRHLSGAFTGKTQAWNVTSEHPTALNKLEIAAFSLNGDHHGLERVEQIMLAAQKVGQDQTGALLQDHPELRSKLQNIHTAMVKLMPDQLQRLNQKLGLATTPKQAPTPTKLQLRQGT